MRKVGSDEADCRGKTESDGYTGEGTEEDELKRVPSQSTGECESTLEEATQDVHESTSHHIRNGSRENQTAAASQCVYRGWPEQERWRYIEVMGDAWKRDCHQASKQAADSSDSGDTGEDDCSWAFSQRSSSLLLVSSGNGLLTGVILVRRVGGELDSGGGLRHGTRKCNIKLISSLGCYLGAVKDGDRSEGEENHIVLARGVAVPNILPTYLDKVFRIGRHWAIAKTHVTAFTRR
jgi:hypothetical protein